MITISPQEVEKRIQAWADVTLLSLELKRAALRKRYPHLHEDDVARLVREETAQYRTCSDE